MPQPRRSGDAARHRAKWRGVMLIGSGGSRVGGKSRIEASANLADCNAHLISSHQQQCV